MKFLFTLIFFSSLLFSSTITIDTKEMLHIHNELRTKYKSPPLIYSKKLESAAKKWAKKLQADGCKMVHSHGKVGEYGENLFWGSALITTHTDSKGNSSRSSIQQVIKSEAVAKAWYSEVKFYDYKSNSCKKGEMCGHYTQLIWNSTKKVGCAALSCKDKSQVWVCEYYPAGNVFLKHSDGSVEKLKPY